MARYSEAIIAMADTGYGKSPDLLVQLWSRRLATGMLGQPSPRVPPPPLTEEQRLRLDLEEERRRLKNALAALEGDWEAADPMEE